MQIYLSILASFIIFSIYPNSLNAQETIEKIKSDTERVKAELAREKARKELKEATKPLKAVTQLKILSVTYNYKQSTCQATNLFKAVCEGKTECSIDVNDKICGKVERNTALIKYRCGDEISELTVPNGHKASLICK